MKKFLQWTKQHQPITLLIIAVVGALGFSWIAIATKNGVFATFDRSTLLGARSLANPALDASVPLLTMLGDVVFVCIVTLALTLWCLRRKSWNRAIVLLFGVAGASALCYAIKIVAGRERPDLWTHLVTETSHSFPSGHATASMALALCLGVVLWHTKYRIASVAGGALYVLVIAFTRIYAGVHYPTDILAGWLLAATWVTMVTFIVLWAQLRQRRSAPTESRSEI